MITAWVPALRMWHQRFPAHVQLCSVPAPGTSCLAPSPSVLPGAGAGLPKELWEEELLKHLWPRVRGCRNGLCSGIFKPQLSVQDGMSLLGSTPSRCCLSHRHLQ